MLRVFFSAYVCGISNDDLWNQLFLSVLTNNTVCFGDDHTKMDQTMDMSGDFQGSTRLSFARIEINETDPPSSCST